jgi:hypothetical protein
MKKIFNITSYLFSLLTLSTRYTPEITWSDKSWVHNIFRCYELICGRRYGIKAESSTTVLQQNGQTIIVRRMYSWESVFAHIESYIRGAIPRKIPIKIWVEKLATVPGTPDLKLFPYSFAIAFDADTTPFKLDTSGVTTTYSQVCTGSNLLLVVSADSNEGPKSSTYVSAGTYATTNIMTQLAAQADSFGYYNHFYYYVGPTTGTNNVVLTHGSGACGSTACSYSGVSQTGFPDASASGALNNATVTMTVTSVLANCWVVATCTRHRGWAAGSNTTLRASEGIGSMGMCDSNGLAGGSGTAGSKSLVATQSDTTGTCWTIASFAPAGASGTLKSLDGIVAASIKSIDGIVKASVKSFNGLT